MIKGHYYKSKNVGDTLTPVIVKHFTGQDIEYVDRDYKGKLLGVGSIMTALRENDVIWGTGCIRDVPYMVNFICYPLAVRGKLTEKLLGLKIGVYGDPALLLPLIYNPVIQKKYEVGIVPHYKDWEEPMREVVGCVKYIDVLQDYKTFINEILSCSLVISSSLHGIIIAEAYGIPVIWWKGSDKIIGGGFKFRDYFSGTGRDGFKDGVMLPPIKNLKEIQYKLISSLQNHYGIPLEN